MVNTTTSVLIAQAQQAAARRKILVTTENAEPPESHSSFRWTTEASQLGLKPGEWPSELATSLGNTQSFVLKSSDSHGTRIYEQAGGCLSLVVFND